MAPRPEPQTALDVLRVGRFRIKQTAVPAREVAFETDPTTRLTISADED